MYFECDSQRNHDVIVEINSDFHPYRKVPERFVSLRGSIDGLADSLRSILSFLPRKYDNLEPGMVEEKVVIHGNAAGKILGKGGQTIREIREQTGTQVGGLGFPSEN